MLPAEPFLFGAICDAPDRKFALLSFAFEKALNRKIWRSDHT